MSQLSNKKLLLFGSGFISRFIALAAINSGIEPILLYKNHPLEDMDQVRQVCLAKCDLQEFLATTKPDYIISLQGNSFVPDNHHLIESLNSNLMITLSFMEQVMLLIERKTISPERIILVGSSGEYGRTYNQPISETFSLHATSIYGLTKIFLFNTAMYYSEKGLPVIYTRQFNCTGPYQRADFVVPSICRQIVQIEHGMKETLTIGDTSQERDFIDVRDAAAAYILLLKQGKTGEIYNIGTGHAVSVEDVLNRAILCSKSKEKIAVTSNSNLFFEKTSLSKTMCADITKLAALGFQPAHTLDDTIRDVLEFWRQHV